MKHLLIPTLILLSLTTQAQLESGVFTATGRGAVTPFVTDYQAIGINPANLDLTPEYENTTVTFGFAEGSAGLYSQFFSREEVRKSIFGGDFEQLNQQDRQQYAEELRGELTNIDIDVISTGISVRTEKAGTFAFSTRERIDFSFRLGQIPSELLFLGNTASYFDQLVLQNGDTIPNTGNLSADTLQLVQSGIVSSENALSLAQALDQTTIGFSWLREFNLAWGKRLLKTENMELHGGIGAKLLIGNGWLQVDVDGTNVDVFSALSPVFGIDYGEIANNNPTAFPQDANDLTPVGYGWGVDLGATLVFKEKLLLSAAINDIGAMYWNGNLYELNDQLFTEFSDPGAESADVIDEVINFSSPESFFEWKGTERRTTNLPTQARLGVGYTFNKFLRIAGDVVLPVSDNVVNLDQPLWAIGGDVRVLPFMRLSAGFVSNEAGDFKLPTGITFIANEGRWEGGLASRDFVTWFTEEDPTVSLAFGFLRFRI